MSKLIAVQGMVLIPNNPSVVCTITPPLNFSSKCLAENKNIHLNGDIVTVTNITFGSATIPDPGPYSVPLNSSALKSNELNQNNPPLLEGDESDTINAIPKTPSSPNPIDTPVSFTIKIQSAGQTKVMSN